MKGRANNRIIYSFRKNSFLNKALEIGIANKQLIIEDKVACFRVKISTLISYPDKKTGLPPDHASVTNIEPIVIKIRNMSDRTKTAVSKLILTLL